MGDIRNEFSWSTSRSRKFSGCKRLYWFDVYGKWPGWEPAADPRTREIYTLSRLKSRWMWAGEIVHELIARILRAYRDGEILDPQEELSGLRKRMRTDFASSRSKRYRQPGLSKTCALREHEYGDEIPNPEWEKVASSAEKCLSNFIQSNIFAELKSVRCEGWVSIAESKPTSFLLDGAKVWVKIDAAHRTGSGGARIIDWKTGNSEDDLTPFQLAVYALFAASAWSIPRENIIVGLCNLSGERVDYAEEKISAADLDAACSHVASEVKEMENLLKSSRQENIANEVDFPPTDKPKVCRSCNFFRICDVSPLKPAT